jgi:hypothetical protein
VEAATATCNLEAARDVLGKMKLQDGSILAEFQRIGKGKVTQHTTTEARYVPYKFSLWPVLIFYAPFHIEPRSSAGFLRASGPSK